MAGQGLRPFQVRAGKKDCLQTNSQLFIIGSIEGHSGIDQPTYKSRPVVLGPAWNQENNYKALLKNIHL